MRLCLDGAFIDMPGLLCGAFMSPWDCDLMFCLLDERRAVWCLVDSRDSPVVIRGAFSKNGGVLPNQGDDMLFHMGFGLMEHVRFAKTGSGYACGWSARQWRDTAGIFVFLPMGEYLGGAGTLERWVETVAGRPVSMVSGTFANEFGRVDESLSDTLAGLFSTDMDKDDLSSSVVMPCGHCDCDAEPSSV